ncbi:MAG: WYL domain-containing protein [Prevotella sp.]|nr:WYL domain-containing protein [Prevotella sp.]
MRHDKLEREMQLILLLIENRFYTVPDLCDRLGISRRNLYYYLEFFRDAGFIVEKHDTYYSISRKSEWLERIGKLCDTTALPPMELAADPTSSTVATVLYQAIRQRRTVVLEGYTSPHSNSQRDRVVEPFLFMNHQQEVRCYEPSTQMNKTFKLSRIQSVKLLDLAWACEECHRQLNTDVFMFSSEEQTNVTLRMGRLAASVLREEYPRATRYLKQDGADHWMCCLPVCSFVGIGRFVMGLFEDIDVIAPSEFIDYLHQKSDTMSRLYNSQPTKAQLRQ